MLNEPGELIATDLMVTQCSSTKAFCKRNFLKLGENSLEGSVASVAFLCGMRG